MCEPSTASLLTLAEAGDGRAMFELAERHRCAATFNGDLKAWPEAHRWYRRAINAGVAAAAYELGVCLLEARGVPMDVELGFTWVRRAVDFPTGGRPDVERGRDMARVGECYLRGEGVAQDPALAVEWFTKGASLGHAGAQLNLALCFAQGIGMPIDLSNARVWAVRAAESGAKAATGLLDAIATGRCEFFTIPDESRQLNPGGLLRPSDGTRSAP